MPRLLPEPPFRHGTPAACGVLLINLGTPAAPTVSAVRRYLGEFLSDPRVVDLPRLLWWPLLHGIVLNLRPRRSAEKYASIWTNEGSPLKVHLERQAKLLRGRLGMDGQRVRVDYAMRYGQPSIAAALARFKEDGCRRLLLLPLYPQYASSTTGSALDALAQWLQATRNPPELRIVRSFADHPAYLGALAASLREHWTANRRPASAYRLLISYHGLPRRTLEQGDPYYCECHKTARLLGEALNLPPEQYLVCFQSRFGRAHWLEPYTAPTLVALAKAGVQRVDVICPGFAADCLETLEEIAIAGKREFLAAGGKEFHYVPSLNERDDWIAALADIAGTHLQGWPTRTPDDTAALELSALRAKALGANC